MCKYVSGASLKDVDVLCVFSWYVVQLFTVLKNSNKSVNIKSMEFLFYYFRVSEIKLESVKSVKVHSPWH